jgi:hypothetical protein
MLVVVLGGAISEKRGGVPVIVLGMESEFVLVSLGRTCWTGGPGKQRHRGRALIV